MPTGSIQSSTQPSGCTVITINRKAVHRSRKRSRVKRTSDEKRSPSRYTLIFLLLISIYIFNVNYLESNFLKFYQCKTCNFNNLGNLGACVVLEIRLQIWLFYGNKQECVTQNRASHASGCLVQ